MPKQTENQDKAQIVYFSHGGGPLPILGDASHQAMIEFMKALPAQLRKPDAILVISAHWEESTFTVMDGASPPMFYDYYGFPEAAYEINYPAPGDPALAHQIVALLRGKNIPVRTDPQRGFDHGLFIPLKLMYPQADIPALQISLLRGLDPAAHLALGNALSGLMKENILVIGSGFSFHNMQAFAWQGDPQADPANDAFQDWLIEVVTQPSSSKERERQMTEWEKAPSARYCHPREEHLMPLHVCVGMANAPAKLVFDDTILGKRAVAFLWQG
ncbi:MAG: DODA-type extradiol aromatic ring-opening family dioxygenase [Anaerolineales bacterium]|jgi:aromatic ring-opening dioxygenase catalytic subunit (LigB family)